MNRQENGPLHRGNGLRIDEDVLRRVLEIAQVRGIDPEAVVRAAIEQYSNRARWSETWLARAERFGLIGCCERGPTDLSTNKDHFEGFGRD